MLNRLGVTLVESKGFSNYSRIHWRVRKALHLVNRSSGILYVVYNQSWRDNVVIPEY